MSLGRRLLCIFVIGLQLWTNAVVGDDPLPLQSLFNIDLTSNDNGGCRGHETRLEDFLFDALDLADAGVNLLQNAVTAADDPQAAPASRLLESYFRGSMQNSQGGRRLRRLIRNNYVAVARFLTEGEYSGAGGKPDLFCSDEWSYYVTWDEPARDNRGQIYTKENKELVRNKNAPGLSLAWNSPNAVDLLWSTVHNAYVVQASGIERRICSVSGGTMGNVQHWGVQPSLELPRVLTLCPRLWGKLDAPLGSMAPVVATQDEIARRTAYADATGDYEDLDRLQQIHHIMPPSATFFHELMHLVLGREASFPSGGEIYVIDDIMAMEGTESARNPESYSKAAVAYWYTTNKEGGPEYWGGFATEG